MSRAARFNDAASHQQPYVPADQTKKDGYLREKWLRLYPGCFDAPLIKKSDLIILEAK